jgi:hypothetical protein
MENNNYVSFLVEGHEVLDSQEFHKIVPGLLGGFIVHSLLTPILSLVLLLVAPPIHAFIHTPVHYSHLSWTLHFIHSFPTLVSLIHVWLGKGKQTVEEHAQFF